MVRLAFSGMCQEKLGLEIIIGQRQYRIFLRHATWKREQLPREIFDHTPALDQTHREVSVTHSLVISLVWSFYCAVRNARHYYGPKMRTSPH